MTFHGEVSWTYALAYTRSNEKIIKNDIFVDSAIPAYIALHSN